MKVVIVYTLFFLLLIGCTAPTSNQSIDEQNKDDHEINEMPIPKGREQEVINEPIKEELEEEKNQVDVEESIKQDFPNYRVNAKNWKIEPIADGNPKVVLLTIDDAPHKHALEMATILKKIDANAIFFVNGHFLKSDQGKEKLKAIHQLGFEIGNHTMNHSNLREISEEKQKQEIIELNNLVEELTGERPRFFRAPYGVNTDYSNEVVQEEGMVLMNWTYGYDWEKDYQDVETLADIMVNTPLLTEGANLLMHDRESTLFALESIVKGLREKGYEMLSPSDIE
ncbi:polysaccharide deacetylase family protein [Bacillus solitudinis]|uniref:polysaccharide deacetylase family protein n=1 Tax=Bacillus solitudinis TaxID=2014074 RepID=UPI000C24E50C|nr:polysaccharide deacetylase family protein [Bacillus solitudinis]